jgi:hypothetical protein
MSQSGFKFIDLPTSAERLGLSRHQLLELVDQGRIKPFSGKGQTSVFRAADVDRLAAELGASADTVEVESSAGEVTTATADEKASQEPAAGRRRKRDPIKLMGTRLSMDSRWAEMSDRDIATWLDALEPVQYERVRKVANLAIERLQRVLSMMQAFEEVTAAEQGGRPGLQVERREG